MSWQLFRRSDGGTFQIVGVDDEVLGSAPLQGLPVACALTIEAPSVLPEDLSRAESTLERLVAERQGRIVGTVRGSTQLRVLSYLPSDEGVDALRSLPLPAGGGLDLVVRSDPEWSGFDAFRPVGLEAQSLDDLRMLRGLFAAGDVGGVRTIDHVVVDVDETRADELTSSLSAVGYRVERPVDRARVVLVHHEAEPSEITPDSWTIRQIAERFGARYDGWRCSVVGKDRPPRRRWFRRTP